MITAAVGLAANLVVFALLREGAKESLNVRGAYLEVLADTLGSVGVLIAGAVTLLFGWPYADPLMAIAIGVFILPRTWKLGKQALRILVEAAPSHIDIDQVRAGLTAIPSVRDVHDLHLWTLTFGMEVGSAHLVVGENVDSAARQTLADRYQLGHATIQVELPAATAQCTDTSW